MQAPSTRTDSRRHGSELRSFFERLREVLDDRRMSQAELARELGVGEATVSEWFTRGRVPQGDVFLRLPYVLGVNGHWLLTGDGPRRFDPEEMDAYVQGARDVLEGLDSTLRLLRGRHGATGR